jgi:hypothetical protein
MAPKEKQKIEIEKTHRDPLPSFNQAVTVDCLDFLGTALIPHNEYWMELLEPEAALRRQIPYVAEAPFALWTLWTN